MFKIRIYLHILAYTCIYMHILSYTIYLIWQYIVRILCTYMHVYSAVFGRMYVFCTYFVRIFVLKVAKRIDFHIIGHTCTYVHILQQIRANTCKYVQYTCKELRNPFRAYIIFQIVYACICKYRYELVRKMYIYKHIPTKIVYACICMYMYVYARILMYIVSSTSLLVPILGKIVHERICTYICVY